jgi:outer membrane protein insertion porin family
LLYRQTDFTDLTTSQYLTDVIRAGVNFGVPITDTDRVNFTLDAENTQINLSQYASAQLLGFVLQYGDEYTNFPLGVSWTSDSRDKAIFPTTGAVQKLFGEVSVPGSDLEYWKIGYSHRRYFPLSKTFTLALNVDIGYGDGYGDTGELPFYEHFYAGGFGTVRGFELYSLGPKDSVGRSYGGNLRTVANVELLFPMPGKAFAESVRLATFFDAGNVFLTTPSVPPTTGCCGDGFDAGDLRYSAGVGATWLSPFGALTVSLAQPLNEKDGDETQMFQFQFGQSF